MAIGRFNSPDGARAFALTLPPFAYAILLLAVPLLAVVMFSFWTQDFTDIDTTFTLENYRRVATEPIFGALLWRSLLVSLAVTTITVMLAYPVAYFVSFHVEPSKKSLWLFLITIPFWTSYLIRVFLWKVILGYNGVINSGLIWAGVIDKPFQMMYTDLGILFGMAYVYLPLMVLPLYASMERLDFRLVEAGYDLYATRFQVLRRIIIPMVKPGIVAGSILVFIPSLGAYVTPRVLGGGKNMMLGNLIELQFGQGRNWPLGSAISITLMAIVMVALLLYVRNASSSGVRHG